MNRRMFDWAKLFRKSDALYAWFERIAERLLNGSRLIVGEQTYRLVEIEFYYWSKVHPDPFTHRDPIQFGVGRWYFHRTGGVHRGGSFKGFDLTFGDSTSSGGILIRGMETADGTMIDGPSLCVDHLLNATESANVATLDRAANACLAWEKDNPLRLEATDELDGRPLIRSPRVGLSLKKAAPRAEATRFVMRSYRYLTQPLRTKKGKLLIVLALHARGENLDAIRQLTNCSRRVVERYIADYETGRKEGDFAPYFGRDLGPADLCKLYGVWSIAFSPEARKN